MCPMRSDGSWDNRKDWTFKATPNDFAILTYRYPTNRDRYIKVQIVDITARNIIVRSPHSTKNLKFSRVSMAAPGETRYYSDTLNEFTEEDWNNCLQVMKNDAEQVKIRRLTNKISDAVRLSNGHSKLKLDILLKIAEILEIDPNTKD